MRTILLLLVLVFSAACGFAQQRHEFTIRNQFAYLGGVCGGGGGDFKDEATARDTLSVPTEPVYIALYAPYDFQKVTLGGRDGQALYTGKMNDTLFGFAKNAGQDIRGMSFTGEYNESGKVKSLRVRLARCETNVDAENNTIYYVCEKCLEPGMRVREKGFFAWFGRLFRKG